MKTKIKKFRIIAVILFVLFSCHLYAQSPDGRKIPGKVQNEKLKEKQRKAYEKQEKEFRRQHYQRQSKEVRKRMKENLKETDRYYRQQQKPLFSRIFPRKYKH